MTALEVLAGRVWDAVEARRRPVVTVLELYRAIMDRLLEVPGYDPETDHRVTYVRQVLAGLRAAGYSRPAADLHETVGMLLGRRELLVCGKDRAGGGD